MKNITHHQGVSERTLEFVLALSLTLILATITRLTMGTNAWMAFAVAFATLCFLQGRVLNRSFVVQVPFLVIGAVRAPLLGLGFFLVYAVFSLVSARVNFRRIAVILVSEFLTYALFAFGLQFLPPELWLLSGVGYIAMRSAFSMGIAGRTGFPLDIGAISGNWAFLASLVFVSTGIALFYFESTEVTQLLWMTLSLVSVFWIFTLHLYQRAREDFSKGIVALSGLLNYSHVYTGSHSRRVAYLARETGRRLRIPEWKLDHLVHAALLHDIGKIAVSEKILEKPGRLTDEEFAEIKKHPVTGQRIVSHLSDLRVIGDWIRYHHERFDGTGYPDRLDRRKIPIESHVICVIDAFDAMTGTSADGHRRLYRDPVSTDEAISELKRCSGTQFDPKIVKHFTRVIEERKERVQ